jgi:hypothetical protein
VIQLRSRKYTRKSGAFNGSDQFYVPGILPALVFLPNLNLIVSLGSRGANGYVTFKFLKDDPQWDDSRYQRLVTFLRNHVTEWSIVECVVGFFPCEFLGLTFQPICAPVITEQWPPGLQ